MMVIRMMLLLIGMPTIIVSGIITGIIIPSISTSMGAAADLWGHFGYPVDNPGPRILKMTRF